MSLWCKRTLLWGFPDHPLLCFHEHGWLWMGSGRERGKPGVLLCCVFSGIGVNPKGEQLQLVAARHVCRLPGTVFSAPSSWEMAQWTSPGQTLMLHQPSRWKPVTYHENERVKSCGRERACCSKLSGLLLAVYSTWTQTKVVEKDARFCNQLFSQSHAPIVAVLCSQRRQQLTI